MAPGDTKPKVLLIGNIDQYASLRLDQPSETQELTP